MKTINELQNEVIEEFSDFDDWMDKYQLLIDLGNEQQPLAPEYKTEQNLIDGCQSRVWLQADLEDGFDFGRTQRKRGFFVFLRNRIERILRDIDDGWQNHDCQHDNRRQQGCA